MRDRKTPKIALISSTRAVFGSMDAAFKAVFPDAEIIQILDETLLILFRQDGGLSVRSRRKALQMALAAQDAGVDGILVTCSSLSPAVDELRSFLTVPIVKIDEPMVEHVVRLSGDHSPCGVCGNGFEIRRASGPEKSAAIRSAGFRPAGRPGRSLASSAKRPSLLFRKP